MFLVIAHNALHHVLHGACFKWNLLQSILVIIILFFPVCNPASTVQNQFTLPHIIRSIICVGKKWLFSYIFIFYITNNSTHSRSKKKIIKFIPIITIFNLLHIYNKRNAISTFSVANILKLMWFSCWAVVLGMGGMMRCKCNEWIDCALIDWWWWCSSFSLELKWW